MAKGVDEDRENNRVRRKMISQRSCRTESRVDAQGWLRMPPKGQLPAGQVQGRPRTAQSLFPELSRVPDHTL